MGSIGMRAIRVEDSEWARAGVYYVRTEAMVLGFHVPLEGEFADDTRESEYILVVDGEGRPLSTNRIHLMPDQGFAKIERVATISTARRLGAGRLGIEAAEEWISEKGYQRIVITSREEAVPFYEKLGYRARYDMDPKTLAPKKEGGEEPAGDPRFVCIYMEKAMGKEKPRL